MPIPPAAELDAWPVPEVPDFLAGQPKEELEFSNPASTVTFYPGTIDRDNELPIPILGAVGLDGPCQPPDQFLLGKQAARVRVLGVFSDVRRGGGVK